MSIQGLNKQLVPINLGQGLDQDTDPKSVIPGKMTTLENAEFNKAGRIDKRDGGTSLDDVSLTGGTSLIPFKDELLQIKDGQLYTYAEQEDEWISKGYVSNCSIKRKQIDQHFDTGLNFGSGNNAPHYAAYANGYSIVSRIDKVYIVDNETGAVVNELEISSGDSIFCFAASTYLYIFYDSGSNIFGRRFDTSDLTSGWESAVQITSTGSANDAGMDALYVSGVGIIIVCFDTAGTQTVWTDLDLTVQTGARAAKNWSAWGTFSTRFQTDFCLVEGPSSEIFIGFQDLGSGYNHLSYAVIDTSQTQVLAPTAITASGTTSSDFTRIAGYNTGSEVYFVYTIADGSAINNGDSYALAYATADNAGINTSSTEIIDNQFLCSDIFVHNSRKYVVLSSLASPFTAAANGRTLVFDLDRSVAVAAFNRGEDVGGPPDESRAKVYSTSSGVFQFGYGGVIDLIDEAASANLFTVDFNFKPMGVSIGDHLLISGGLISCYDGKSLTEINFWGEPVIGTATTGSSVPVASSGGSLADGTYSYIGVYEWKDDVGKTHRSQPSLPVSVTVSAGTGNAVVSMAFRTVEGSQKSDIKLVLYRTEDGGSVYYRLKTDFDQLPANTPDTDKVYYTVTDGQADASLISNTILYTEGGVLENEIPPGSTEITAFQNRYFLSNTTNGNDIWFSHEDVAGAEPRFSSSLKIRYPDDANPVNGMGVLGDKLVAFQQNGYRFTYGDGPNEQGLGGQFARFQVVPTATGCKDPRSIVETPLGIMFKSSKGIYLMDTSLQSVEIGAPVDDSNDETVTSAVLLSNKDQIRFTTEDGNILVYDYSRRAWGEFTNMDAYDACLWKGENYVVLRKTGADVFQEVSGTYQDDGTDYALSLETGWINFSSFVGIQRVRKLVFVGERESTHTLRVSVAYDFSSTYDHTVDIVPDTALDDGASGYYPYRIVVPLKRQKCQSVRFKLEELSPSSDYQALNISFVGLEVALKKGVSKIRAAQKAGTS